MNIIALAERYLPHSRFFVRAVAGDALPEYFVDFPLASGETLIGSWHPDDLPRSEPTSISTVGVRGDFDGNPRFVPYASIADLRMPDPGESADESMHELMFYTNEDECIFFPLLGWKRDFREAAILFRFSSSIVAAYAAKTFSGKEPPCD